MSQLNICQSGKEFGTLCILIYIATAPSLVLCIETKLQRNIICDHWHYFLSAFTPNICIWFTQNYILKLDTMAEKTLRLGLCFRRCDDGHAKETRKEWRTRQEVGHREAHFTFHQGALHWYSLLDVNIAKILLFLQVMEETVI